MKPFFIVACFCLMFCSSTFAQPPRYTGNVFIKVDYSNKLITLNAKSYKFPYQYPRDKNREQVFKQIKESDGTSSFRTEGSNFTNSLEVGGYYKFILEAAGNNSYYIKTPDNKYYLSVSGIKDMTPIMIGEKETRSKFYLERQTISQSGNEANID